MNGCAGGSCSLSGLQAEPVLAIEIRDFERGIEPACRAEDNKSVPSVGYSVRVSVRSAQEQVTEAVAIEVASARDRLARKIALRGCFNLKAVCAIQAA